MAERRMFTQKIVDSDAFLDMPLSTQALYFHLNMRADDDGFINNPKKIQRMIGASDDDLKLLIAKRFVLAFESGVIVIKHWRMHNLLRKDRYNPTQYQEEYKTLELKDNGSYTELGHRLTTTWQPTDNQVATQDSIGKDSIEKVNKYNKSAHADYKSEFEQAWSLYPKKQGKKRAYEAYVRSRKKGTPAKAIESGIYEYIGYIKRKKIEEQFIKQGSTFFAQEAWADEWTISKSKEKDVLDGIL